MGSLRSVAIIGLLLASLVAAPPAHAQSGGSRKTARALAEAGLTLFEAQRWSEAYDLFQQANGQVSAPTFVLYMAHCSKNLGKLVQARALYQKVANAEVAPGAPSQFTDAKRTAARELTAIEPRIVVLQLAVEGHAADQAEVTLDGVPFAEPDWLRKLIDPGEHVLRASAPGAEPLERSFVVAEGAAERVTLQLRAAVADFGDGSDTQAGSLVPAIVAFGVAGAGLALGIVTGAMSLGEVDDLKSRCRPDNHCPAADQPQADEAERLAAVSTVGFVVAGIGVATGVTLLLVRPGAGATDQSAALRPAIRIGPGSISLQGSF